MLNEFHFFGLSEADPPGRYPEISPLHGHRSRYMGMRIVSGELEVLELETEQVFHIRVQFHPGERARFTRQLQTHLVEMVGVNMRVAQRMDEISGLQPRYLSHHLQQQGIRGDIEGDTQKNIRAALV